MILTTKTQSGRNTFGEATFTETSVTDDVVVQFIDALEDPAAGNIRIRELIAVTNPENLSPRVGDEASINGVTYRILEVRAVYSKGVRIADKVRLQEEG